MSKDRNIAIDVLPGGRILATDCFSGTLGKPRPGGPLVFKTGLYSNDTFFVCLGERKWPTCEEAAAGHRRILARLIAGEADPFREGE